MSASAAAICAEVVLPGVEGSFSYRVPASLAAAVVPGARVLVPFGRRRLSGVLVEVTVGENARATREIEHVLDQIPAFTPALLKFTRWVADYYLCPWGDVLKAALPAGISLDEKRHWMLAGADGRDGQAMFCLRHPQAEAIFEALRSGPVSPARMEKQFGCGPRAVLLKELQAEGIAVLRPVLKPPRVKSHFDSLVTLTEALRSGIRTGVVAADHIQARAAFAAGSIRTRTRRSAALGAAARRGFGAAVGVRAAGGESVGGTAAGSGDALGSGE